MRRFEPHSTAMSPSAFPAELYDKIIDELAPSKDELSVCSLVSHSWAPRSRTHMFRNVNYTACPSPEKTSSKRAEDFQRYLANSTIASYARHLSLTLTNSDKNAEIPHASRLVNLQSLTIHGSNTIIYSVNDRALTRLLSFIRHNANLERFSLESVVIDPSAFDVFIGCIAIRAPRLQSLHLNSIVGPDWITDAWNRRRAAQGPFNRDYRSISLTRLCISHCEDGVIPAFLRAFDLQRLGKLALVGLDWEACAAMVSTTLQCSQLEHLTVDLSDHMGFTSRLLPEEHVFHYFASIPTLQLLLRSFSDAPNVLQKLQLSALLRQPSLRHLHLQFKRYPYPTDTMVDKWLTDLCSVIPSLRISIWVDAQEGVRPVCTIRSMEEIPSLFRSMARSGALKFAPLEKWWAQEIAEH